MVFCAINNKGDYYEFCFVRTLEEAEIQLELLIGKERMIEEEWEVFEE